MTWVEDYRPTCTEELVGNQDEIREVIEWAKSFTPGNKACLLYGPPGVGKTSLTHTLANDLNLKTFEINASDERTESTIGDDIRSVATSSGFGSGDRLIIVDEVDNLDRGGASAIRSALDEATQRVILTCNDYYDGVPNSIQDRSKDIEFSEPGAGEIYQRLGYICNEEGIAFEDVALQKIAKEAEGDVRSAINDLEVAVEKVRGMSPITKNRVHGELNRPQKVLFFGDTDPEDHGQVKQGLEMVAGQLEDIDRVVIPGRRGTEIIAGEWFTKNGYEVHIHPPWGRDQLFDDEIWEMRYNELTRDVRHFPPTDGEVDVFEEFDLVFSWGADSDFGQELSEKFNVRDLQKLVVID
jgi:hypothetical protein